MPLYHGRSCKENSSALTTRGVFYAAWTTAQVLPVLASLLCARGRPSESSAALESDLLELWALTVG